MTSNILLLTSDYTFVMGENCAFPKAPAPSPSAALSQGCCYRRQMYPQMLPTFPPG